MNFREQTKVTGNYIWWVGRLSYLWNAVFSKKLLHKLGWIGCIVMVNLPLTIFPTFAAIYGILHHGHVLTLIYGNVVEHTHGAWHNCHWRKQSAFLWFCCTLDIYFVGVHGEGGHFQCINYLFSEPKNHRPMFPHSLWYVLRSSYWYLYIQASQKP